MTEPVHERDEVVMYNSGVAAEMAGIIIYVLNNCQRNTHLPTAHLLAMMYICERELIKRTLHPCCFDLPGHFDKSIPTWMTGTDSIISGEITEDKYAIHWKNDGSEGDPNVKHSTTIDAFSQPGTVHLIGGPRGWFTSKHQFDLICQIAGGYVGVEFDEIYRKCRKFPEIITFMSYPVPNILSYGDIADDIFPDNKDIRRFSENLNACIEIERLIQGV